MGSHCVCVSVCACFSGYYFINKKVDLGFAFCSRWTETADFEMCFLFVCLYLQDFVMSSFKSLGSCGFFSFLVLS